MPLSQQTVGDNISHCSRDKLTICSRAGQLQLPLLTNPADSGAWLDRTWRTPELSSQMTADLTDYSPAEFTSVSRNSQIAGS